MKIIPTERKYNSLQLIHCSYL